MAVGDKDVQLSITISSSGDVTLKALKQELKGVESSVAEVNKELDSTTKQTREVTKASVAIGDSFEKTRGKIKETTKGIQETATAAIGLGKGFKETVTSGDKLDGTIAQISGQISQMRDSLGRFTTTQRDSNKEAEKLTESLSTSVTKGILLSDVVKGVAGVLVGLVTTVFKVGVGSFITSLETMANIFSTVAESVSKATEKFERFTIALEGALKSSQRAREISEFVQAFALRTPQRVEDLQELVRSLSLIPSLSPQFFGDIDQVKERLSGLFDTVIGLASLNPQQGIPGAVFALREALTGQFRSLRARFDIMPEIVAGSINKTVSEIKRSPTLVIKALKEFTDQVVGSETTRRLGELPSVRIGNILEGLTSIAPRQIGETGVQKLVQQLLGSIDDKLQEFLKPGSSFETQFAQRIGDNLQRTIIGGIRVASAALKAAGIDTGAGANPFEALANGLEGTLDRIAGTVERFASALESQEGQSRLQSFFGSLESALESFFNGLQQFIKALPSLLPVFGQFIKLAGASIEQLFKFVASTQKALEDLAVNNPQIGKFFFGDQFQTSIDRIKTQRELSGALGSGSTRYADQITEISAQRARRQLSLQNFLERPQSGGSGISAIDAFNRADREDRERLARATIFAAAARSKSIDEFKTNLQDLKIELSDPVFQGFFSGQTIAEFVKQIDAAGKKLETIQTEVAAASRPSGQTSFLGSLFGLRSGDEQTVDEKVNEIFKSFEGATKRGLAGTIGTIKDQGLQVKERLDKALLNPFEEAQSRLIEIQDTFESGIANLGESLRQSLENLPKETDTALSFINVFNEDDLKRGIEIIERERAAREKVLDIFKSTREEAERFRSISANVPIIELLQDFVKTDPRRVDELRQKIAGIFTQVQQLQPVLTGNANILLEKFLTDFRQTIAEGADSIIGTGSPFEDIISGFKPDIPSFERALQILDLINAQEAQIGEKILAPLDESRLRGAAEKIRGFIKTLGEDIVKQLAGFSVQIAAQEAQKLSESRGAFGRGAESQVSGIDAQIARLNSESEIQSEINRLIESRAITESERGQYADRYRFLLGEQTKELLKQREVLTIQNRLQSEQREFQRRLTTADTSAVPDETRLSVIRDRMAEIGSLISKDDNTLGTFFGLSSATDEAIQRIRGLRDAKTEELKDLTEQEFQLALSIQKANKEFERQKVLTTTFKGQLAQQLDLVKQDRSGNPALKTLDEAFSDSARQAALQYVSTFKDTVGTTIYDAITGRFDDIGKAWTSLFDNLLRTFANFVADILIKSAALEFVKGLFNIGASAGGVSSAVQDPGLFPGGSGVNAAIGGVYGIGGITNRAQLALIGEGGRRELVAPLTNDGRLPLVGGPGGLYAILPGGRRVPTTMSAYANGGVTSGSLMTLSSPSGNIANGFGSSGRPVYVVNVLNPNDVVAAGLPANADIVMNHVAGDIRNLGKTHQAIRRYR